jgi:hypothetical protein
LGARLISKQQTCEDKNEMNRLNTKTTLLINQKTKYKFLRNSQNDLHYIRVVCRCYARVHVPEGIEVVREVRTPVGIGEVSEKKTACCIHATTSWYPQKLYFIAVVQ